MLAEDAGPLAALAASAQMPRTEGILRSRALACLVAMLYVIGSGLSGLTPLAPNDLDAFFLPATRIALAGHPLQVYSLRYQVVYPNANGPLSLVPLTLVGRIIEALGWMSQLDLRRTLIMGAFSIFVVLLAREAAISVEWLSARPLGVRARCLIYAAICLSPQLWHSVLFYGHIEQPLLLWLVLLGVRLAGTDRPVRAGLCLGLAMLTRSTALLVLLPVLLVLAWNWRWRAALLVGGVAAAVTGLGILPFWLGDQRDTLYSLVTFHRVLVVGGGNVWGILLDTSYASFALTHDSFVVVGVVIVVTLGVLIVRRRFSLASPEMYALLALTNLCFPLLIKTLWPYYFLETYVYCAVWAFAAIAAEPRPIRRRAWLRLLVPVVAIGCAQLAEHALSVYNNGPVGPNWSLVTCGAMLLVLLPLAVALLWRRPRRVSPDAAPAKPAPAI